VTVDEATIQSKSSTEIGNRTLLTGNRGVVLESLALGLVSLGTVLAWMYLEVRTFKVLPPFEDAAMLYRYAVQLADGNGIIWNPGESPSVSDGATDLGFVLVLAPLIKLGLAPAEAGVVVNLVAIFFLGALFGVANRLLWCWRFSLAALLVILIASGPVNRYVSGGFSAPVLGLLLSAVVVSVLLAYKTGETSAWHRRLWLAASGLLIGLAGWWRPEGFVLGIMLLAATAALLTGIRPIRVSDSLWVLLPASSTLGAWVLFRLIYFGQLLPTSAVMKVDAGLHLVNGQKSALFIVGALLPLLAMAAVLALFVKTPRFWVIVVLLGVSSAVWVMVALTMNWWDRMQWPLVPAIAVVTVMWIANATTDRGGFTVPASSLQTWASFGLAIASIAAVHGPLGGGYWASPFHTAVAGALAEVDTAEVRLATTEAGLIPLAIRGSALDTGGHNHRGIAESNGASLGDALEELQPNVVMTHGVTPPALDQTGCEATPFSSPSGDMITKLYVYAEVNGLELLRSTRTGPCDTWSVFVTKELPGPVRSALLSYRMGGEDLI
jgi:hypothetical protein